MMVIMVMTDDDDLLGFLLGLAISRAAQDRSRWFLGLKLLPMMV